MADLVLTMQEISTQRRTTEIQEITLRGSVSNGDVTSLSLPTSGRDAGHLQQQNYVTTMKGMLYRSPRRPPRIGHGLNMFPPNWIQETSELRQKEFLSRRLELWIGQREGVGKHAWSQRRRKEREVERSPST